MFLVFRKWTIIYILSMIVLVVSFALILRRGEVVHSSSDIVLLEAPILIIDPGHGGEDGGAVAPDGTVESHINLAIAETAENLARFMGWSVYMTRSEDISIHDSNAQTLREKKRSDLKNRVELCNRVENGILVSIHQNSMPSAKSVRGAQVFYNECYGSAELANAIQNVLNRSINQNRPKETKMIGSSSYLMKNVTIPAALVECGFLSNESEVTLLKSKEYQKKLAVCIVGAVAGYWDSREK